MLTVIRSKFHALKTHQGFRRYAVNTSWMMAEQLLRITAGLFVGIWVARYLGPEEFGLFSYVIAFTAIFGGIAKLGLDGIMVRELVNKPEMRDIYLGTAFWLKICGAFIVMALIALIVPVTSNDATTNLFIFIISAGLVFQSFEVVEFYFQSQVLARIVSICKVVQLVLSSSLKIYLVIVQAELFWFVLVTAFDAMSLAISYSIAYQVRKNASFYPKFDFRLAKKLLNDSWPFILSAVVIMIYMRIDQIMIKEILGSYEVGIYSAAVRLSEAFYFFPTLVSASLFPAIINAKSQSPKLYQKRMQYLYTLMIWLAIGVAVPVTFIGDWLVVFLFGSDYQQSAKVLQVHIWSSIFVFLLVSSGKWFVSEGLGVLAFYRNLSAVFFNILMNFLLIPRFGVVGAAWATLVSFFVSGYLFDAMTEKTLDQFKIKTRAFFFWLKEK